MGLKTERFHAPINGFILTQQKESMIRVKNPKEDSIKSGKSVNQDTLAKNRSDLLRKGGTYFFEKEKLYPFLSNSSNSISSIKWLKFSISLFTPRLPFLSYKDRVVLKSPNKIHGLGHNLAISLGSCQIPDLSREPLGA